LTPPQRRQNAQRSIRELIEANSVAMLNVVGPRLIKMPTS